MCFLCHHSAHTQALDDSFSPLRSTVNPSLIHWFYHPLEAFLKRDRQAYLASQWKRYLQESLPALTVWITSELAGIGQIGVLFTLRLIRTIWKVLFTNFLNSHMSGSLFFTLLPWFWFEQLELVKRNTCVCMCQKKQKQSKTKSSSIPSVATDSSDCVHFLSDKAWAHIQLESVELFEHTWSFGRGLLGWTWPYWRISSFSTFLCWSVSGVLGT